MRRAGFIEWSVAVGSLALLPACGRTEPGPAATIPNADDRLKEIVGETISNLHPNDPLRMMYQGNPFSRGDSPFLRGRGKVIINAFSPQTTLNFTSFSTGEKLSVRYLNKPPSSGQYSEINLVEALQADLLAGWDLLRMRSARGREALLKRAATPIFFWGSYVKMCEKWMGENKIVLVGSVKPYARDVMAYEFLKNPATQPGLIWQRAGDLGVFHLVNRMKSNPEMEDLEKLPNLLGRYREIRDVIPDNSWGPYGSEFAREVFNLDGNWVKFVLTGNLQ